VEARVARVAAAEVERRAGPESGRAVAADAWSGLARLARCAGEVLAARREGGNSAAAVFAQVAGFADLREELQAQASSDSPAGVSGTLGGACAEEEKRVRASRAKLEQGQREVRRSAQLARAKEGPASGCARLANLDKPGFPPPLVMRTPQRDFFIVGLLFRIHFITEAIGPTSCHWCVTSLFPVALYLVSSQDGYQEHAR